MMTMKMTRRRTKKTMMMLKLKKEKRRNAMSSKPKKKAGGLIGAVTSFLLQKYRVFAELELDLDAKGYEEH